MNVKFQYNPIREAAGIARVSQCGKMGFNRRLVRNPHGNFIDGGMDVQGDSRATWAAWSKSRGATTASAKRTREEAEEAERVVSRRPLTPTIWKSAAMRLSDLAQRLRGHRL